MRKITITPVLNGWKCTVGCQEVVFTSKGDMFENLGDYIDDPQKTEERFLKEAVNKHIVDGGDCRPAEETCNVGSLGSILRSKSEQINKSDSDL